MASLAGMDTAERNAALLAAVGAPTTTVAGLRAMVAQGAEPFYQETRNGESVMMRAGAAGRLDLVQALLELGAPWNAVDRRGQCAGTVALKSGHQEVVDCMVKAGVRSELFFIEQARKQKAAAAAADPVVAAAAAAAAAVARATQATATTPAAGNPEFVKQKLKYVGRGAAAALVDERGAGVMMQWEKPLMEAHAKVLCMFSTKEDRGADVLNVGFGMGLIDTAIQNMANVAGGKAPRTHTIIEAHPDVYAKMLRDGWDRIPGVRIFHGRWQDVLRERGHELGDFDGVFFDTFDDVDHMRDFHAHLQTLVRPGGIYSFFNGLCPENIVFQGVACQCIQIELGALGFDTDFYPMSVACSEPELWEGTPFRYYFRSDYHLPLCRRRLT
jgi:protein arginine N-methyltransferase 2